MKTAPQLRTGHSPLNKSAALAQALAIPMFCLSLLYLICLAGLTVVWVDMATPNVLPTDVALGPDVTGAPMRDSLLKLRESATWAGYILFGMLMAIWPLFLLEPIFCRWHRQRNGVQEIAGWTMNFWAAVCPPLRLAKPINAMKGEIWLPKIGWHRPGKPLAKLLDKVFSKPMLIIAMLILPILLIEFGFSKQVQSMMWLKLALSLSTGFIWCAFAIEFIIMVSATDRKFAYVKKNWIDLAIILLPLVSFLRSLRIVRAANIAKFAKVQQLTKMSRIYRMRGLLAKSIRALMVLEVLHRVFNVTPEKLRARLEEIEQEAAEVRSQIRRLQSQVVQSDAQSCKMLPTADAGHRWRSPLPPVRH